MAQPTKYAGLAELVRPLYAKAGKDDVFDQYQAFATIYANLFEDETKLDNVKKLRDALSEYVPGKPGSAATAIQVLTALDGGKDPQLSTEQLTCLARLFYSDELTEVAPFGTPPNGVKPDGRLMKFWKSLYDDINQVAELQQLLGTYKNHQTSQNRENVLAKLKQLDDQEDWQLSQVWDLMTILVGDISFHSIIWQPLPDNLW